jgi:uncharacterized caspase-like protein
MRRFGSGILVAICCLLAALPAAHSEERLALLIGNQSYSAEIGRLSNPHNDIALLEKALKGLRFEVTSVRDAGLAALHQAVNAYARRVRAAGPGAIAFFYYAGHGAADGGVNYLIPVDVKSAEEGDLWDVSLRLTEITGRLRKEASNATHFVVFDACRNELKLRKAGTRTLVRSRGFVPVAQEAGMLIAYATAEGELASDVGAAAGPYSSALAEEIVKPGVEAVTMFRNVQLRVRAAIGQEPWIGFSALGRVHLAGLAPERVEEEARRVADELAWSRASGANRLTDYEAYLAAWPEGTHATDARNRVDHLKALRLRWQSLESSRNLPELADFVHAAADTEFGPPAQVRLAELSRSELEAWEVADKLQTVVGYRRFFLSWPDGYYKDAATARIRTLEEIAAQWEVLRSSDNEAALEAFVTEHGWSEPGAEAVARLVALRREREHPSGDNVVVLTARELAAAMDGKDVEFVGSGVVIRFDSRSTPQFRQALGRDFLKSVVKEDVVIVEGAFRATSGREAHASDIEGLAAVVQSRVDNTGSLFLIQMHGSERARRDVDQKDRLHSAISIIRSPYGYVCVRAQWSLMLAGEPSRKLSESCRIAVK